MNQLHQLVVEDKRLRALVEGVGAAMGVVFEYRHRLIHGVLKEDNTYVTAVDEMAERAALPNFAKSNLVIVSEESGIHGASDDEEIILVDPLDGTRAFMIGAPTSTVIAATYNRVTKQVTRCVVGEVISGRVWIAAESSGTWVFQYRGDLNRDIGSARLCTVWMGEMSLNTTVFLDLAPTFVKPGYPQVPHERWCAFLAHLYGQVCIGALGSNGLHHALVANGGDRVLGTITISLGGPWDVVAGFLVKAAGGHLHALSTKGGSLVSVDPLDVTGYNYLVSGNTPKTVERLTELLKVAVRP